MNTEQSPHQLINPENMAPAKGFSQAVVPAEGKTVYLSGQVASDQTGAIVGETFVEQYDLALWNIVTALRAAGGEPTDIVSLIIYTTSAQEYRDSLPDVGVAHRKHLGRHFPAMALFGVTELFDPAAKVEIMTTAVVADR
ncbi:MAG: RidA family protein [Actinobacteria bacterium]|nr:MAG: RidA family protein [Actinomycetota bacterium]